MRAKLQQLAYQIRGSYWFIPAIMAILAIVASQLLVHLDREVGPQWMAKTWWASLNQPEGARALLATVAGSMITVTGVTFSLTILAVSYATSHFGPRLLDNFMRDRGNQITLGVFVATFLYCLMVLRTVRAKSSDSYEVEIATFVPHISIFVAIALTITSVGVLIFFIHHIPESISVSRVLSGVSDVLHAKILELYPESIGEASDELAVDVPDWKDAMTITSHLSGYLQGIDETSLMNFATHQDVIIELKVRPGDFLIANQVIANVARKSETDDGIQGNSVADQENCSDKLHGAFAVGDSRTPSQDIHLLFNQFVEVAARALSPGVNDPFTAIQCIDKIGEALSLLSQRELPSRFRLDQEQQLRIVTTEQTWKEIVHVAFGRLVPYAKDDVNVTAHLVEMVTQLREVSQSQSLNDELKTLFAKS